MSRKKTTTQPHTAAETMTDHEPLENSVPSSEQPTPSLQVAIPTAQKDTQMTPEHQELYLQFLLRGASPAMAAQQLGIDLFLIVETIAEDDEFRIKVDAVYDTLSQNVATRLYQEAMKGSLPAMTLWLKHRPPPEWPDHPASGPASTSPLGAMTDEELIRLARLENVAIPPELEADSAAPRSR